MTDDEAFRDLIRRVRAGDQQAAYDLVRQYEPEIRRAVRVRLDEKLGRVLDSVDVCQSVMGNFFVRAAAGQFDLEHPAQLFKLLVTMARNKILDHFRRDQRQPAAAGGSDIQRRLNEMADPLSDEPDAAEDQIMTRQLHQALESIRPGLEETTWRAFWKVQMENREPREVADEMGMTPAAVRKARYRVLERLKAEMGELID